MRQTVGGLEEDKELLNLLASFLAYGTTRRISPEGPMKENFRSVKQHTVNVSRVWTFLSDMYDLLLADHVRCRALRSWLNS